MRVPVIRKSVQFLPDSSRVVARYFNHGDEPVKAMLDHIFSLNEDEVSLVLDQTFREFSYRHRNITQLFERHFNNMVGFIENLGINISEISRHRRLLIGSFLTHGIRL